MQEPQTITGKDIDYQYVSSGEILQLLKTQKPWEWIRGFFETKNYMVQEETVFSREKLEEQVSLLNCAKKENQIAPENAYVSFSNSEFTIVPETEGSELNAREAYQMISGAIDNEAADVDMQWTVRTNSPCENTYIREDEIGRASCRERVSSPV